MGTTRGSRRRWRTPSGSRRGRTRSSGSGPTASRVATCSCARCTARGRRSSSASSPRGIAVLIGLIVGLLAGYFRGFVDTALSRGGDVMLALPQLLIAIGIVAACSSTRHGLRRRADPAGAGARDRDHRALLVALRRPPRARLHALAPREGVRRGEQVARREQHADHLPGDPPEPGRADHRLHDAAHPAEHPLRGRALLPRARRPAHDRIVGRDS